jgi:cell division protein FtsQ
VSAGPTRLRPRPPDAPGGEPGPTADRRFRARRRSLRLRRWVKVGIPLLMLVLVGTAAWVVLASPFFAVTTVRVVGAHRLSPVQVEQAADIPTGRPLVRVDVAAAEQRVEQMRVVRSAVVTRSWPHTVVISIVERVPVATAQTSGGGWLLLDADAVAVTQASTRPQALVLLHLDPDTVSPDTLRAAAAVAAALPDSLRAKVDDITAASADSVRLDLAGGGLVRWGDAQDSATKARVLAVLLTHHAHIYDVTAPGFATTS